MNFGNNEIYNYKDTKNEDTEKLDEQLVNYMNLLEDNDISTEVESEESIPNSNNEDNNSKKIILSNYLYINEENIKQARLNTINKYLLLMKKLI